MNYYAITMMVLLAAAPLIGCDTGWQGKAAEAAVDDTSEVQDLTVEETADVPDVQLEDSDDPCWEPEAPDVGPTDSGETKGWTKLYSGVRIPADADIHMCDGEVSEQKLLNLYP